MDVQKDRKLLSVFCKIEKDEGIDKKAALEKFESFTDDGKAKFHKNKV